MLKISSRETLLLIILLGAVLVLVMFFIVIGPAQDEYNAKNLQLSQLQLQKSAMDNTIAAGKSLLVTQKQYQDDASQIESKLLPTIKPEVIAQVLQSKFVEAGIPFFVNTASDLPEYHQTMLPDGTFSSNQMVSVIFTLRVSGSDGYFPTLLDPIDTLTPSLIGYDEFVTAMKDIEDDLPQSIKLKAVTLEDSAAGFMYYELKVEAFAFSLTDRISAPNMEQQYVTWTGPNVNNIPTHSSVGIPFNRVPPSSIKIEIDRPFTLINVTKELLPAPESITALIDALGTETTEEQPAA